MSKEIAVQAPPGAPTAFRMPGMSKPLLSAVYAAERGGSIPVTAAVRAEASRLARALERPCAPAGPERVWDWLRRLNLGLSNPLAENELRLRSAAIAEVVHAMPAAVFTDETRVEAAKECDFFPGAKKVHDLLRERATDLTRKRHALLDVAGFREEEPRRPKTAEEIDRVLAAFRPAWREAMAEAVPAETPARVARPRATSLAPGALAELRRRSPAYLPAVIDHNPEGI